MGRLNHIQKLPSKIKEEIHTLIDSGHTIDAITAHLHGLGAEVSRSSVGRYKKSVEEMAAELRESRAVADALIRQLGDAPEEKATRLNIEFLHHAILKIQTDGAGLEIKEAAALSSAIRNLAQAKATDAKLTLELKENARKDAMREMEEAAKQVMEEEGSLSPKETFARIMALYRGEI